MKGAALAVAVLAAACTPPSPSPAGPADMKPAVLLLDGGALLEARAAVRAGRDVAGLAELRREADAAAGAAPMTVTDKTVLAPSGDPHDYVSLSIYWWPDPTKPDGLPYVQKDGVVDPEASDTKRYDASKLNRMVGSAETLALAAYITGERRYADAAASWLRTWFLDERTRMNPSMAYSQVIPGRPQPRGTGIIDSRQLMRAVDAALLLEGTPPWTKSDADALRAWFGRLADWLVTSVNGTIERNAKNNHGTWYDAQLAGFAIYGGREKIAQDALARVSGERTAQIAADGAQAQELARTRSYHYSAFNLLAFAVAADLAPSGAAEVWAASSARLRPAIDLLVRYADAIATWPYQEIGPLDLYMELAPVLTRAARAYPDAGYDRALAKLAAKASSSSALRLRLGAFGSLGGTAALPAPLVALAAPSPLPR